ncbi:hypothetical protein FZEAL_10456 [Fusarium zealandicum]|uniref:Sm protein F n=1 Tax=Fusarium zealandicum TaxID=1053134 RepID=A0A8H4XBC2_9HYPO|nr:hypothetical protein FZEAL_10456 [Fusarium zealandicum]
MSFTPINPRPMLQDLVSKIVLVRLKWGEVEYKGTLVSVDSYMNLQLSGTEEYINDKPTGSLGQVLIRQVPDTCAVYSARAQGRMLTRGVSQVQQRAVGARCR